MSLFVAQHRHDAAKCPAKDQQMGAMLLRHLSPGNAKAFGLRIQGEAIVNHTLYLIVDGPDRESVQRFMQPFAMVGTVEISPAATCEEVVTRGDCGAA